MSDLTTFRDHCRCMTKLDAHRDDCRTLVPSRWTDGGTRIVSPDPACSGCVPTADRALFARLADEVDAYLAGDLCPHCGKPVTSDDEPLEFVAVEQICQGHE